MKISYAITVCNEIKEIKKLIPILLDNKRDKDEIVVLFDKQNGTAEVWSYLQNQSIKSIAKSFKHHFADWKNKLTEYCNGDYIFQIDADEYPHETLIEKLPEILEGNPDNDVYLVPRVNTVEGLTEQHIQKWGWRVSNKGWVNWPDYQWRIWKNKPEIKWINKVHERLDGFLSYAPLPDIELLALYHPKDIKRQEKQNNYYNKL
jgi:glycosyltransferase involved in cell wall biosynthesis